MDLRDSEWHDHKSIIMPAELTVGNSSELSHLSESFPKILRNKAPSRRPTDSCSLNKAPNRRGSVQGVHRVPSERLRQAGGQDHLLTEAA